MTTTIDLAKARRCNETDREIERGMYAVVNVGSQHVLAVSRTVDESVEKMNAIDMLFYCFKLHDVKLAVAMVQ